MSYAWYVPISSWLEDSQLLKRIGLPDLRCVQQPGDARAKLRRKPLFHREGVSLRNVEVEWTDGQAIVRLRTLCGADDVDLGLRLVEALAHEGAEGGGERVIATGDDERLALSELRQRHDADWIARTRLAELDDMAAIIGQRSVTLGLAGPRRDFCLGPRTLARLRIHSDPRRRLERLHELMHRVQWVDRDGDYYAATRMTARSNGTGTQFAFTAWEPSLGYLFPRVDCLSLRNPGRFMLVAYKRLPEMAGDHMAWLDDDHALVEKFTSDQLPALLDRAAGCEVRIR
jgi:hypothetical protein